MQSETSRVWIFMYPLLAVPIGLELSSWSPRQRLVVFSCLALLANALSRNMAFNGS
jgi:hypothetical protein